MSITLYWYWTTNPQKIRIALEEIGLEYTLKKIHLGYGDHLKKDLQPIYAILDKQLQQHDYLCGDF